jgi:non-ribosomal peptide synthetase component F
LRQLLARVRGITFDAYAHQSLPFEHLVQTLARKRQIDSASLFQVMFVYHNLALETSDATSLSFRPDSKIGSRDDEPGMTPTTCDLILLLKETSNGLRGSFDFKADSIPSRVIDDMRQAFIKVVKHIILQPGSTVREICAKVKVKPVAKALSRRSVV